MPDNTPPTAASPAKPDAPKIEGFVETLSAQRVTGWAWEPGSDRPLVLQILLGERVLGETVADRFRKDLQDGNKGTGHHAFEYHFPAPLTEFYRVGYVRVRVRGTGRVLALLEPLLKRLAAVAAPAAADAKLPPAAALKPASAAPPAAVAAKPEPMPAPPAAPPPPQPKTPAPSGPARPSVTPAPASPFAQSAAAPNPVLIISAPRPDASGRAAWLTTLTNQLPTETWSLEPASPDVTPDLAGVVQAAIARAAKPPAAVIVSPASFAGLAAGALIRRLAGTRLIVDLADAPAALASPAGPTPLATIDITALAAALATPGADLTPAIHALTAEADATLAANPVQRQFPGGMLLRDGRDARLFDPAGYDRARLRAAFGYAETDRIVLLHGGLTPADGIIEVAEAMQHVADPRLTLCLVGAIDDPAVTKRLAAAAKARIALHPPQPPGRIAALVAMADCVAVLQSAAHPTVRLRVPPALIDALAMDVPVIATPAPPLQDIAVQGAVRFVRDAAELHAALREIAAAPAPDGRIRAPRAVYLAEFSSSVNAARLSLALAIQSPAGAEHPATLAVFSALQAHLRIKLPFAVPAPSSAEPSRQRLPLPRTSRPRDLVFMAADNASDLSERRPDMAVRALLEAGKIARILHLDARLSAGELERQAAGPDGAAHRGSLIYANAVRRVLGLADTPKFLRRTFLHRRSRKTERMMGRDLPAATDYADFVRQLMREHAFDEPPLLWVCAGAPDASAVRDAIGPALVIADLWAAPDPPPPDADPDSAAALLKDADLVLAVDAPTSERLLATRPGIHLLPEPPSSLHEASLAAWWRGQIEILWAQIEQSA